MNKFFFRYSIYLFIISCTLLIGNQKTCKACNKDLSAQYLIHKGSYYHHTCYDKYIQIYCEQCGKKIDGSYNTSKGKSYHKTCYQQFIQKRCEECSDIISGIYTIHEGKEYHESCYIEYIIPKCDVCHQPVEDKYIKDFWGNYYHAYHDKKMPSCDNCSRLICSPLTNGGYSINSNRFVCNICKPSVIKNKSQLRKILNNVLDILKTVGIVNLPTDLPITLIDSREELIRMSGNRLGNIQGYTNYEESSMAGRIIDQKYHIYILSNLHEEIFKAVLAHELLHVYLFQNKLDLRSDIREGFCNLGSDLIYEHYGSKLSKYRLKMMNESTDPDYGIGYKKMKEKLDDIDWKRLLKKLPRF